MALPPPPVAPAPEPVPPESGADSVAAPSTAAAPKPEAAGKPPSQEGGRKLLELLPRLGRRHDVGHSQGRTTPESQAGPAAQAEEHGHGQDEEWQEEEGSVDEEEQRTERERHGGAGSSQPELMLPTRQNPLQSEGSSTVLVASGAQLHVSSSRQGTQHREHAADDGADAEGAKESHV